MLPASLIRSAGTVQIFLSRSISGHRIPRISPERAAVRRQSSSASAEVASRFPSFAIKAAKSSSGIAANGHAPALTVAAIGDPDGRAIGRDFRPHENPWPWPRLNPFRSARAPVRRFPPCQHALGCLEICRIQTLRELLKQRPQKRPAALASALIGKQRCQIDRGAQLPCARPGAGPIRATASSTFPRRQREAAASTEEDLPSHAITPACMRHLRLFRPVGSSRR
jgi:hypothetical protein